MSTKTSHPGANGAPPAITFCPSSDELLTIRTAAAYFHTLLLSSDRDADDWGAAVRMAQVLSYRMTKLDTAVNSRAADAMAAQL